ncbi:50S ribosomal protein L5 [Christensenellaceae bacterium OttesenSCG-928-L17]|nr:50S ribosomal protein L5 [Christensenellaceae bacterium OttesenSCG-928-L17]
MAKKEAAAQAAPAKKKGEQTELKSLSGVTPRLKTKYIEEVVPALKEKFSYENVMQVPRLEKIIINMGLGSEKDNPKGLEKACDELAIISGQKPYICKAKKSVANFKVREGMNVGAKVTLRGDRMYYFADKLMNIVLPRVRDFRGVSTKSFDGRGNYAMGVKEQLIFPEVNYDDVDKVRGMDIIFVTTAKSDEEAKALLDLMGMPFVQG